MDGPCSGIFAVLGGGGRPRHEEHQRFPLLSVVRDSDSAGDGGEIDDTPFDRVVLHGAAEGAVVAVGVVVEIIVEEVSDKVVGKVVGEELNGKVDEDVEEGLELVWNTDEFLLC